MPESAYPHRPVLLGHRGTRTYSDENTLSAFASAFAHGADGVEFDVLLSLDGVPVVIHDARVDRTLDATGSVNSFTAHELQTLGVPTLVETLAACPSESFVNVELKTEAGHGLVAPVLHALRPHLKRLHLVLSSFDPIQLLRLAVDGPDLPLGALYDDTEPALVRWAVTSALVPSSALHPPADLVSRELVRRSHRAGLRVHVWNVRTPEQADMLLDLGVDALIVDDIPLMRPVFSERFPLAPLGRFAGGIAGGTLGET